MQSSLKVLAVVNDGVADKFLHRGKFGNERPQILEFVLQQTNSYRFPRRQGSDWNWPRMLPLLQFRIQGEYTSLCTLEDDEQAFCVDGPCLGRAVTNI
jgi:hypothetical protein